MGPECISMPGRALSATGAVYNGKSCLTHTQQQKRQPPSRHIVSIFSGGKITEKRAKVPKNRERGKKFASRVEKREKREQCQGEERERKEMDKY